MYIYFIVKYTKVIEYTESLKKSFYLPSSELSFNMRCVRSMYAFTTKATFMEMKVGVCYNGIVYSTHVNQVKRQKEKKRLAYR
jgi:hypothetical protein